MTLFNRFIIKDFTKERYLAIVRGHPILTEEKTHIYIMLTLTFASLSFLGIFAINPTLTTIVELNRKLSDSEFVSQALKTKIANLSSLRAQYEVLTNSWPIVEAAVPGDPRIVTILGQMHTIAKESNVQLKNLQSFEVELSNPAAKISRLPKEASYVFSVTVIGSKENLLQFVKIVSNFDRVVAIESINYSSEGKQSATIRARAFFSP